MTKLLIALVIIGIIAGAFYFEHQRGSGMAAVASKLGLAFQSGQQRIPEQLEQADFDLFTQGAPDVKNLMVGEAHGLPVSIFDYSYRALSAGEGGNGVPVADDHQSMETRSQSVIWVRLGQPLPDFDLSPSGIHNRTVAARYGFNRVTFDAARAFNDRYVLLARDAQRVRALFSGEVRDYLLAHPDLVFEARAGNTLFYRFEDRVDPSKIPAFLQQVQTLLGLLKSG
jgi:hypothetical protein